MGQPVEQYVRDNANVPAVLGGSATVSKAAPGLVAAACAEAKAVSDGEAGVGDGLTAGQLLLRSTVERAVLAHCVAAYLGSTACPLPEELARPLCELTAPYAERWRALGHFRAPMPLPPYVAQRDRLLLTAGHEPHPLRH